ncbi:MAG: GGDEF and EAL domain-containing protein [Proteobacteria bacterium]|nr:GGDEF and EAL domain-containing protein [Pseudomonadota bacterium]
MALVRGVIVVMLALLGSIAFARAEGIVEIPARLTILDLSAAATPVVTTRQNATIQIPGGSGDAPAVLQLNAKGRGPEYKWTVFTVRNSAPSQRKLVLLIEEQRFVGSGILVIKPYGVRPRALSFSAGQDQLEAEPAQGGAAVNFVIGPNATVSFGVEAPITMRTAKIYSQAAFAARESSFSFMRGAVLTLAGFLVFASLALYGIRAHTAFIAGAFFALTAMGFMALDAGYLAGMAGRLAQSGFPPDTVRAAAESLLLLGLAVCGSAFLALRQRGIFVSLLVLLLLGACLANLVYAYVEPIRATQIARIGFAGLSALIFILAYLVRNSVYGVVRGATFFWAMLVIWTFYAAVAALQEQPVFAYQAALLGGLAFLLIIMTWTLVRFAFAQGFLAKPFLTDANRRSLALSGAQHFIWDWYPLEGRLDIGAELASSLGYKTAEWIGNPEQAFLSILHPDDEPSYRALMDTRSLKANTFNEQELRLRDARNTYRWFNLRMRALPGVNNRPARCIGTLTEVTRHKAVEDRLMSDAVHDPVTGLPSRAIFADRLTREINKPLALPVQVLFVGLERFKTLNDGLGHDLGDQLLLIAGRRISDCLAPVESVARLSGSQFAVMFVESIDSRGVKILAEQIKRALAEPVVLGNQEIYLSPSIGISLSSGDGYSAESLLDQAAAALQQAQKQQGRQAIHVYQHTDEAAKRSNVTLESELRRAVDRNEIEVLYQPIVELEQRTIVGLEALARWRHPQEGLLQPSRFLAMAEQAGMMPEITQIVLSEASRQMGIWQRTVIRNRPVYVAVNIPADQLTDTGFVERLRSIMNREGLLPHSLKIEITESVAMRHLDRARQFISRLRALGIGVACDDFGTGFSSLASLRDLPFDTLKIDRSFLLPEAIEGRGGVILDTVVTLAHNLSMTVVAEGIESEAQAERVQVLGCDLGQGFYFAEPLAAAQVRELLLVLPDVPVPPPPPAPVDEPPPGAAPMAPRAVRRREDDIFEERAEPPPPLADDLDELIEAAPVFVPVAPIPFPEKPKVAPAARPAAKQPAPPPKSVAKSKPAAGPPAAVVPEAPQPAAKPKRRKKGRPSYKNIY